MIDNLKITKGIKLIISLLIFITILQSCKGQSEKPNYNPKAIEFNNKAVQLMQQMEYDSALILFYKAIEIDKNYYLPYSNMAEIYLIRKQFDKALQASDKVVEIKPDLAEGWTFAGMLYDRQGDTLTAKKYYNKSIEIFDTRINNPEKKKDLTANRLNRAISLILLGQEAEGKDELEKLKTENPDDLKIDEFLKINKQDYIRQLIDNK
ncbi:MAG: Tetratricopeptide repeat protein [Bacteroidetes bacterium ADurb.BinA174]|nr:MAG: Tetratricopeptide repeat protein [Bacteroidetes bacterium ADurb.BinA174]